MGIFRGLQRTDYQDVLRTIGHYIDQQGFTLVRIIETEDGIVLQGNTATTRGETKMESYLLTLSDLQDMMREAYARRGTKI